MKPDMLPTSDVDHIADVGVLRDLVGYHLRRANNVFAADFAHTLAGTGMRQVLFGIISVLSANPGINQGSAGRSLGIQRANMVSLINELVDAGLVNRQVSPDDRRAFSLSLTEHGEAVFANCTDSVRAHEASMLADLSDDDRRKLIQLLSRIEAQEV